jgi:hypothetical protein
MAERRLVLGQCDAAPRLAEMGAVDAGGEGVDVVVAVLLRLVEAVAAGEDDVGIVEQLLLERSNSRRREAEIGELVHAVVDGAAGSTCREKGSIIGV